MITLKANIGQINPLEGSRIHCRLLCTLVKRCILAEPTAEADGTIITSEAAAAPSIDRLFDVLSHYILASIDDKSFPDVTTYDIVDSINMLVVTLVV